MFINGLAEIHSELGSLQFRFRNVRSQLSTSNADPRRIGGPIQEQYAIKLVQDIYELADRIQKRVDDTAWR